MICPYVRLIATGNLPGWQQRGAGLLVGIPDGTLHFPSPPLSRPTDHQVTRPVSTVGVYKRVIQSDYPFVHPYPTVTPTLLRAPP